MAGDFTLPRRSGEAPRVGSAVPQLQETQKSPREVYEKVAAWAFSALAGVREEPTRISVPATRALWLDEGVETVHDDAFMPPSGGRELAHLHADGSMHLHVDGTVAREVYDKGWGCAHPLDPRSCMVYAPRDDGEVEVIKRVIVESYRYATGRSTP